MIENSSFADVLIPLVRYRRRILLAMAAILVVGGYRYVTMEPKYIAHVSLVALIGAEYGLRTDVGESASGGSVFDVDQIMTTESQLLKNPELEMAVVRKVGLTKLYPAYTEGRTGWRAVAYDVRETVEQWLRLAGLTIPPRAKPDPLELARNDLDDSLKVTTIKASHVLHVTFSHKDPQTAALTLNALIDLYLLQRSGLYTDEQAPIVQVQVNEARDKMITANAELAQYKAANDIGAYETRRINLLSEQTGLEQKLQANQVADREYWAQARELQVQLATIPVTLTTQRDVDVEARTSAQRASIDALEAMLARLRANYSADSPAVKNVEQQLAARRAEMNADLRDGRASLTRVTQNPLWTDASGRLLAARTNLLAGQAANDIIQSSLKAVEQQLHTINQQEEQLSRLEEQRKVAEDNYLASSKLSNQREVLDTVEQHKKASVRVVEPAAVPTLDNSLGKIVVLGTVLLAIVVGVLIAFLSDFGRRVYLTPREVERDLGAPVLVSIPHRRRYLPGLRVL